MGRHDGRLNYFSHFAKVLVVGQYLLPKMLIFILQNLFLLLDRVYAVIEGNDSFLEVVIAKVEILNHFN